MPKVIIVDYNVGNIFSMKQALNRAGFDTKVTSSTNIIRKSSAIVLPGVGNFGAAVVNLSPFAHVIKEVVDSGIPMLGSCLGMQLLFEWSEESKGDGLGLMKGGVVRFSETLKTPHMGWNTINIVKECEILDGVEGEYFYFVHSYYPDPLKQGIVAAVTDYGGNFASVVSEKNIYGTQFHPEKSSEAGAKLLENFANIVKR